MSQVPSPKTCVGTTQETSPRVLQRYFSSHPDTRGDSESQEQVWVTTTLLIQWTPTSDSRVQGMWNTVSTNKRSSGRPLITKIKLGKKTPSRTSRKFLTRTTRVGRVFFVGRLIEFQLPKPWYQCRSFRGVVWCPHYREYKCPGQTSLFSPNITRKYGSPILKPMV